jgi:transposase
MIKVDQYHLIKDYYEREGLLQRQITKRLNISRNTVRKYVTTKTMSTLMDSLDGFADFYPNYKS